MSGGVLLSHAVPHAVPSALKGLTSGFGMGPGVSPSLKATETLWSYRPSSGHAAEAICTDRISRTAQWTQCAVLVQGHTPLGPPPIKISTLLGTHAIRTAQLRPLP